VDDLLDKLPLPDMSQLDGLTAPKHRVLADLVHGCSPDPEVRTAATTALALGTWQQRRAAG
jgi:hypothetical protein